MSDDDEYRFHPDDFDGEEESTAASVDRAPLLIVGCLGVGVGLFFAEQFIAPVAVAGTDIELSTIGAVVIALGLSIGGGSYARRGRLHLGAIHAVGALGWLLLAAGTIASSTVVLVGGGACLVASTAALVALVWRSA